MLTEISYLLLIAISFYSLVWSVKILLLNETGMDMFLHTLFFGHKLKEYMWMLKVSMLGVAIIYGLMLLNSGIPLIYAALAFLYRVLINHFLIDIFNAYISRKKLIHVSFLIIKIDSFVNAMIKITFLIIPWFTVFK